MSSIQNNKYLSFPTALSAEERELADRFREPTPFDNNDPNWEMVDNVPQRHETLGMSHMGGEFDAMTGDLQEHVYHTHKMEA